MDAMENHEDDHTVSTMISYAVKSENDEKQNST